MTGFRLRIVAGGAVLCVLVMARQAPAQYLHGFWLWSPVIVSTLGSSGGYRADGSPSWDHSLFDAMMIWNIHLGSISLRPDLGMTPYAPCQDGRNHVWWSSRAPCGEALDRNTLATTQWWHVGGVKLEADITFNSDLAWNSYRGPSWYGSQGRPIHDFRRVALHELGHLLGFDHPDERGYFITSVMNSTVDRSHEVPSSHDVSLLRLAYGLPPSPSGRPVSFPPRDQSMDFRRLLEAKYQTELRRPQGSVYVDPEGSVVWVQEYLRYRLNGCSHVEAVPRVMLQIEGRGVQPVCVGMTSTSFPPRQDTLWFRRSLEVKYRR